MPLARLLAAGLLFCSPFAFTRKQQPSGFGLRLPGTGSTELKMQNHYALVFPNRTISHGTVSRLSEDTDLLHNSHLRGGARDRRGSNSTHSLEISTCQPSSPAPAQRAQVLRRAEGR